MSNSYLNAINYYLDTQYPVRNLSFLQKDPAKMEQYLSSGGEYHYKTDKSAIETSYWLLSQFIEQYPFMQKDIDFIIFTSDDLDHTNDINVLSANSIINELGFTNAFPLFQNFSNCANLAACFNTAVCMVESGRAQNVLVISVDHFGGNDDRYKMESEMSVMSDAGVCLWISSAPVNNAMEIGGIYLRNNPMQWLIDKKTDYQTSSVNKLRLYKFIANQVKKNITGDIDHLIFNNYFQHINQMFLSMFNIASDAIDFSNVSRMGHAPAGDGFINLSDLISHKKIQAGQNIVIVSDSPSICIGIMLKSL